MKTSCCDVFNASDGNPLCTCCDDSETGCLGFHVACEEYLCPLQSSVVDLTFFGSYRVGGLHHHSAMILSSKTLICHRIFRSLSGVQGATLGWCSSIASALVVSLIFFNYLNMLDGVDGSHHHVIEPFL